MEQALKKYPYNENSVLANYILGVAYEKSNDYVNAQKQYEKVHLHRMRIRLRRR